MDEQEQAVGFALSQEELLAFLLIADLPILAGSDDLESRVYGGLSDEGRLALLAAAERALLARGFLEAEGGDTTPSPLVLDVVRACATPAETWIVVHKAGELGEQASFFHQAGGEMWSHTATAGLYQFVQMTPALLRDLLVRLIAPVANAQAIGLEGEVPEDMFQKLVNRVSAQEGSVAEKVGVASAELASVGMNGEVASAFAQALAASVSMTALAYYEHDGDAVLRRAMTVVRGEESQWVLGIDESKMLSVHALDGERLTQLLEDFGSSLSEAVT